MLVKMGLVGLHDHSGLVNFSICLTKAKGQAIFFKYIHPTLQDDQQMVMWLLVSVLEGVAVYFKSYQYTHQ